MKFCHKYEKPFFSVRIAAARLVLGKLVTLKVPLYYAENLVEIGYYDLKVGKQWHKHFLSSGYFLHFTVLWGKNKKFLARTNVYWFACHNFFRQILLLSEILLVIN